MSQQFSALYPPKNRRPHPLPVVEIEIVSKDSTVRMDMNQAAVACHLENLPLGEPFVPSDLSGKLGYEYRSSEITLALTRDELYRLMRHALYPKEFFLLAEKYGIFFETHDDFYDEKSGSAHQMVPRAETHAEASESASVTEGVGADSIIITTSTAGDWVRVTKGHQTLVDGHSVSPRELAELLRTLGHVVTVQEKTPDEF
jgi:hypothetical protein